MSSTSYSLWVASGAALSGTLLGGAVMFLALKGPANLGADPFAASAVSALRPGEVDVYSGRERSLVQAVAQTRDTVVGIKFDQQLLGAGVVVHPNGSVLTNYHVVEAALMSSNHPSEVPGLLPLQGEGALATVRFYDGREFPAELYWADEAQDIAFLRIVSDRSDESFAAAPLGESANLRVGQSVFVVGCPVGLEHTVSAGIVSALDRTEQLMARQMPAIQLDATINFGNSGGPLFNLDGQLVGITTTRSRKGDGIGFAIPIDQVRVLLANRSVSRRWSELGVEVGLDHDVGPEVRAAGYRAGIKVVKVNRPDGEAEDVIRPGDIIVALRGKRFDALGTDPQGRNRISGVLAEAVRAMVPGDMLSLTVLRKGEVLELSVPTLAVSIEDQVVLGARLVLGMILSVDDGTPRFEALMENAPAHGVLTAIDVQRLKSARLVEIQGKPVTDLQQLGQDLFALQRMQGTNGESWVRLVFEGVHGEYWRADYYPLVPR